MSRIPFRRIDGYITAVYLDGAPPADLPVRGRADDITYDAKFVDANGYVVEEGFKPYNRRYRNTSIISANIDDLCDVQLNTLTNEIKVYVHTERDDLRDCDGNPVEDL